MNKEVQELEPKAVWKNFVDLNQVPRPSKKEEKIIQFMVDFGKSNNLETHTDAIGNVIIKKPASKNASSQKPVILQSHIDMVHQKNNDTDFDFSTEGIKMYIDKDWVRAKGTTLGADNGLGVAAIMAILTDNTIEHPPIEALFTVDEETGMTGAKELDPSFLEGKTLLNLDTEEDDVISVGCAGGIDVTAHKNLEEVTLDNKTFVSITVKGLSGGHSGMDIDKGLGNANLLVATILKGIASDFNLISFDGGSLRNAIPREAKAVIAVSDYQSIEDNLVNSAQQIHDEYSSTEPNMEVIFEEVQVDKSQGLSVEDSKDVANAISNLFNGVHKMSEVMEGTVEASNNVARVLLENGTVNVQCLSRSSQEDTKQEVVDKLKSTFDKYGFNMETSGDYPGWQPNLESNILKVLQYIYKDLFNEEAIVEAGHGGLECGIIGDRIPGLDMVSFGPTIKGAHSPDERASIESTKKFWKYLKTILAELAKKN